MMRDLLLYAEKVAVLLKSRSESIAIAESFAGGLITAALLAVPTGNRYGDPAGCTCIAVAGRLERPMLTGSPIWTHLQPQH